jgi:hypothetical protein
MRASSLMSEWLKGMPPTLPFHQGQVPSTMHMRAICTYMHGWRCAHTLILKGTVLHAHIDRTHPYVHTAAHVHDLACPDHQAPARMCSGGKWQMCTCVTRRSCGARIHHSTPTLSRQSIHLQSSILLECLLSLNWAYAILRTSRKTTSLCI